MTTRSLLAAALTLTLTLPLTAADWPRFRGPNGTGTAAGTLPTPDAEHLLWKAPIPGKGVVGIEIPNPTRNVVSIREMLESPEWTDFHGKVPLALGREIRGHPRLLATRGCREHRALLDAIRRGLAANEVHTIVGILNGTCNFILTRMLDARASYAAALAEAQSLGYAEADPAMDVNGTDAAQKLTLLTLLAFGTRVRVTNRANGRSVVVRINGS